MTFVYQLEDADLQGPRGVIAGSLCWDVPTTGVTAILGPSGTGKSTLLRALSGQLSSPPWHARGRWSFRGAPFDPVGGAPISEVVFCPQPSRGPRPIVAPAWFETLRSDPASFVYLVDEPDRWFSREDHEELVQRLRGRAAASSVILVTHDLSLARKVADRVLLLAGGRAIARRSCEEFFDRPQSPLVRHFIRDGNLCPEPPSVPELPEHFRWVLPGKLGGMAYPGLLGEADLEFEAVASRGTTMLVSLTLQPFPTQILRRFGIEGLHLPIADMQAPASRNAATVCARVVRVMDRGDAVVFHCHAGLGRTGLMLAAVLVWMGRTAEEAVSEVRSAYRGYIQSEGQLAFVYAFEESLGRR
jgi:atypical dual specificity phosphatase